VEYFHQVPSTVENIAIWSFTQIQMALEAFRVTNDDWVLKEVEVHETSKNSVRVTSTN